MSMAISLHDLTKSYTLICLKDAPKKYIVLCFGTNKHYLIPDHCTQSLWMLQVFSVRPNWTNVSLNLVRMVPSVGTMLPPTSVTVVMDTRVSTVILILTNVYRTRVYMAGENYLR